MRQSVLTVTPYFLHVRGGVTTMVRTLTRHLKATWRTSVVVTAEEVSDPIDVESSSPVFRARLRRIYDPRHAVKAFFGWLFYLIPVLREVSHIIAATQPSLLHLHFATSDLHYFRIVCRLRGLPYVVTLHGSDVIRFCEQKLIDRILIRYTLTGAARVIAVSEQLARQAEQQMPWLCGRLSVIPNGVDIAQVAQAQAQAQAQSGTKSSAPWQDNSYFISVGGLLPIKGHDVLINAWPIVRREFQDLHLVIVGDGPLRQSYRELIERLGCNERVWIIGEVPYEQIWSLMRKARALIMPSRNEGLSYAILEAGVNALPVIATNVGGNPELITDGKSGLLIPPDDPDAIARAIGRLLNEPGIAGTFGRNLQRTVEQRYPASKMVNDYASLYMDVLRATTAGR